jgi:hypothetical protein
MHVKGPLVTVVVIAASISIASASPADPPPGSDVSKGPLADAGWPAAWTAGGGIDFEFVPAGSLVGAGNGERGGAQSMRRVRVVQASAILNDARGDAPGVGSVSPGQVLEVLDEREDWYLVRPLGGAGASWRTGWIARATVTPMPVDPAAPPDFGQAQSFVKSRKGFVIGFGVGGGLHQYKEVVVRVVNRAPVRSEESRAAPARPPAAAR